MIYTLICDGNIATSKSINYTNNISEFEIEITENQYNQLNEFPVKLTIENSKVVLWEKIEISHEPIPIKPQLPTTEDRIAALETSMNFLLGM